jgi:ATP-binding cassette subfamily F protein uup
LPARIEGLERELAALHATMADPEIYKRDPKVIQRAGPAAEAVAHAIEAAFARWAELSDEDR